MMHEDTQKERVDISTEEAYMILEESKYWIARAEKAEMKLMRVVMQFKKHRTSTHTISPDPNKCLTCMESDAVLTEVEG